MTFENPEVIEFGVAEELIQDTLGLPNTEGTMPERFIDHSPVYVADAE